MASQKAKKEEKGPGVPIYIVTFSDMVTLLLTFFVMLLSMAEDQSSDLFEVGQTSFKRALADMSISGFLFNKDNGPKLQHPKVKYPVDEGKDKDEIRSIDSQSEMIRRVVLELERTMQISPSVISGKTKSFTITDISFKSDSWSLNKDAEDFLTNYSKNLQETSRNDNMIVYVVGFGASEPAEKLQWIVSARRAQTVAKYLESTLPPYLKWKIFSWGAGDGGDWVGAGGVTSKNTEILIVALNPNS